VTGREKYETVTVPPVFNALGEFGPVTFIMKGFRMKLDWATGSPSNAMGWGWDGHWMGNL